MKRLCMAVSLALVASVGLAQSVDSASADMGEHSRFTNVRGDVTFEPEKGGGLIVRDDLRGLDAKAAYDLHLLSNCPETAPFDRKAIDELKQARRKGRKLLTMKAGEAGKTRLLVKDLALSGPASVIGKGLLLSRGDEPVECAVITPPFAPFPGAAEPANRN